MSDATLREWVGQQISTRGWGVLGISGGRDPFSYTLGLRETCGHPELLLSGMPRELAGSILNSAGDALREGERFAPNLESREVLEGFPVTFALVPVDFYYEEFGGLQTWREGMEFAVLQLAWPDREGRFPWSGGATEPQRMREDCWWATAARAGSEEHWVTARAVMAASLNVTCRLHGLDPHQQCQGAAERRGFEPRGEFLDALSKAEGDADQLSTEEAFAAVHELLPAFVDLIDELDDPELNEVFAVHFAMRSAGTL